MANSQIKLKGTMLKSGLCDYSDAYILGKGAVAVVGHGVNAGGIADDRSNKQVSFKNCLQCNDYISKMNNTKVDNKKHLDIVMPMFNFLETVIVMGKD